MELIAPRMLKGLDRKGGPPRGGYFVNQLTAAAINISNIALPAANQINQSIKSDTSIFNNIMSLISSADSASGKAEIAAIINSNPAVKTALYQAVTAMHVLGEASRVASSDRQLLEANPIIRQAVSANNLTGAEKEVLIKAVKIAAEIITAKMAAPDNAIQAKNPVTVDLLEGQPLASKQADHAAAQKNMIMQPAVQIGEPAAIKPAASAVAAVDNTVSKFFAINSGRFETETSVKALSANPAEPAIAKASLLSLEILGQKISNTADVKAVLPETAPVKQLLSELREAIKVFVDERMGLISGDGPAVDKAKAEIKAAAEIVNLKIGELDAVVGDEKKSAEAAKIVSEIISGLAGLFAAVEGSSYAASTGGEFVAAKPVVSTAYAGVLLKEMADSVKRIEVALSDYSNSSSKEANTTKEVQAGLRDVIAKIYTLLKEMNGRAEVTKTTQYVHAPNASFSMRVTQDGNIIINTGAVKPEVSPQALPNPQVAGYSGLQSQAKAESLPMTAAGQPLPLSAPVVKEATVPLNGMNNERPELYAQKTQVPAQASAGTTAATPQVLPVVVNNVRNTSYHNSDTFAGNNAKENAALFGAITEEVSVIKTKEAIQVPVEAKVFERVADAAGIIKGNIVIKQVVQNIKNAIETARTTEVKMILRPENLGSITVRLEAADNIITGKIQASSAEVRDILKNALPELRVTLNNLGLNADRLEITLANSGGNNGFEGRETAENYREWEGGILKVTEEEIDKTNYAGLNGYLSFLA